MDRYERSTAHGTGRSTLDAPTVAWSDLKRPFPLIARSDTAKKNKRTSQTHFLAGRADEARVRCSRRSWHAGAALPGSCHRWRWPHAAASVVVRSVSSGELCRRTASGAATRRLAPRAAAAKARRWQRMKALARAMTKGGRAMEPGS